MMNHSTYQDESCSFDVKSSTKFHNSSRSDEKEKRKSLKEALKKLAETMEKEMVSNQSTIYNEYNDMKYARSQIDTDFSPTMILIHGSKTSMDHHHHHNKLPHMTCTGSSWNSLGSSLAVSFGNNQANGWSFLPGYVTVVQMNSQGVSTTTIQLDYHVSILCTSFHPESPELLACGLVNGEIIIWDVTILDRPEDGHPSVVIRSSVLTGEIIQVSWIRNNTNTISAVDDDDDSWLLYCGSANGTLLAWSLKNNSPVPLFQITSGLCSFGVGKDNDIFIGRANGFVTQVKYTQSIIIGSEMTRQNQQQQQHSIEKGCDNEVSFRGHIGPVNSITISPFDCTIFASCCHDGSILIFRQSSRQTTTAIRRWESLHGHPLTCVQFSPHHPCLLAVSSADGFLHFFDLRLDAFVPILVLNISHQESGQSSAIHRLGVGISSFCFNPRKHDSMAVCDSEGAWSVWKFDFNGHDDKGILLSNGINHLKNLI